jgi:hypothetical protein
MTIEVYVGCSANGEDAESLMVLDYSIHKHTKKDVNVHYMMQGNGDTWTGWDTQTWATPFSGFRWSIPEHCNFEGRSIYMDSDMIVLSDIDKLWKQDFHKNKAVMAKGANNGEGWRYCVCMWDNPVAKQHLLPISRMKTLPGSHQRLMHFFANHQDIVQPFDGEWNCVDGENLSIEDMDILHYSDMSTQLHAKYALPRLEKAGQKHWFDGNINQHWRPELQELFDTYYQEALDAGYKVEDYIPDNLFGTYVKESQANYDEYRNMWSA